jgi:OFA family oxalate/formate antiporter-like MFS transporter
MASAQSVFSVYMVVFTIVFMLGGKLLHKFGTLVPTLLGSLLFASGFLLAGMLPISQWSLILSIGTLSAAGLGLAYVSPMYVAQKVFADKKALMTGVTIAGFGMSALIFSFVSEFLLDKGFDVSRIFRTYGSLFALAGIAASLGIKVDLPKGNESASHGVLSLFKSSSYWMLFFTMFGGLFAGLLVITNIKTIGLEWGVPLWAAILGVPVISLSNAMGRVIWGAYAHVKGESNGVILSLLVQAMALMMAVLFVRSPVPFLVFAAIIGINYGANLVLFPSLSTTLWGVEAFGHVYPLIFLCNAFAGFLAPIFGGRMFDLTSQYSISLLVASAICLVSSAYFYLLWKRLKKSDAKCRAPEGVSP